MLSRRSTSRRTGANSLLSQRDSACARSSRHTSEVGGSLGLRRLFGSDVMAVVRAARRRRRRARGVGGLVRLRRSSAAALGDGLAFHAFWGNFRSRARARASAPPALRPSPVSADEELGERFARGAQEGAEMHVVPDATTRTPGQHARASVLRLRLRTLVTLGVLAVATAALGRSFGLRDERFLFAEIGLLASMFVISRYVLPLPARRDRGARAEEHVGSLLET